MLDVYYVETFIDGEPYDYVVLRVPETNCVIESGVYGTEDLEADIVLPAYWVPTKEWNVTYIGSY